MFIKNKFGNNYFGPFDVDDNSDSDLWMLTLRSPGIERRTCRLWVRIPAPAGSVHDWDPWARHRTPDCSPAPMFFFLLLIVQFLETKITNQCIIYSQKLYLISPEFSVTLHLKVFWLNKHVFVIIYVQLGFMLHLLLFNESSLHYLSIMCVCMNDYILVYTSACGETTCDEHLFYLLHYYGGCGYVIGTKLILIAVCVFEFSGLHSNVLVCKLQFFVLFYKTILQPQLPKLFCKNYRFVFYSVGLGLDETFIFWIKENYLSVCLSILFLGAILHKKNTNG